jgi:hypothetical protein
MLDYWQFEEVGNSQKEYPEGLLII